MSKLSRAIKFVIAIWLVAFGLATPQALQFGVVENGHTRLCTFKNHHFAHAFEVSSFLFFVGPMTVIAVLYVLIGIKLRKSKLLQGVKRQGHGAGCGGGGGGGGHHGATTLGGATAGGGGGGGCSDGLATSGMGGHRAVTGQTRVIRMLVAVVATFFFCWAPFHAQRLMAVYGNVTNTNNQFFFDSYTVLTYISGILYFLSTCINPLLYHIMSHKFRDASRIRSQKRNNPELSKKEKQQGVTRESLEVIGAVSKSYYRGQPRERLGPDTKLFSALETHTTFKCRHFRRTLVAIPKARMFLPARQFPPPDIECKRSSNPSITTPYSYRQSVGAKIGSGTRLATLVASQWSTFIRAVFAFFYNVFLMERTVKNCSTAGAPLSSSCKRERF
ncbi:pyrokinin receptor [Culex quinquefasciatus]|uniref:Pyrokinin receptor n=1 Tax=Culex quinquefasciatus TaxID=7176 RepID=B0WVN8_CULQU|nr:pyrokinin receptor [Culex quinquefasciatus]|eukprot:XP_001861460.1 pyrokinin receptor [Culex quinquefasciatus]